MEPTKEQIIKSEEKSQEMNNDIDAEEDVPINPFYKHLKNIDLPTKHEKQDKNEDELHAGLRRVTFCGAFQDPLLHTSIKASTRKSILKSHYSGRYSQ